MQKRSISIDNASNALATLNLLGRKDGYPANRFDLFCKRLGGTVFAFGWWLWRKRLLPLSRQHVKRISKWHPIKPENTVQTTVISFCNPELNIAIVVRHEVGTENQIPDRKDKCKVLVYVFRMARVMHVVMGGWRKHNRPDPWPSQPHVAMTQIVSREIENKHQQRHTYQPWHRWLKI